ncbi:MAG: glycosyltransferase, partial [Desulfovibrio sp.]|nr:glycosyltransferase [Desulfovibrio sp.]
MRIALVTPVPFSPHSLRPLQGFLAAGHEVVLCAPENPLPEGTERYHFFAHAYSPETVTPLLRDVGRWFSPHVVHAHFADELAWHAAQADAGPLVLSVWGSDINGYVEKHAGGYRWRAKSGAKRLFLPELLRRAAHVVVDAASMFAKCRFVAGRDVPMSLIHLGVDTSLFVPADAASRVAAKRALGLTGETPVLFSPRALAPDYGHDEILEAFAALGDSPAVLLFKRFPKQAPSAAIAQWREKLHCRVAALGLQERVLFVDELAPDLLPGVYAASDAIINMPVRDAFPVTLAEAGAMRVPIITVPHEAYASTFAEGCSLAVPFGDIPKLAAAMRLAVDGGVVTEGGLDRAREAVLAEFSHAAYGGKIEDVNRECADGGASGMPAVHAPLASEPKIGVLIPCYNAAHFLPDALNSLQAQTYENWEAIVVDDCSNRDDPAAVVKAFADPRIRLTRHERNSGQAAGRNTAAAATDAPLLLTLDADDKLHPMYMRVLVNLLQQGCNDVVFSSFCLFGGESGIWTFPVPSSPEKLTRTQSIPGPGSLFRREVWERVGGYDTSDVLRQGNEDWEFWIAAIQQGIKIDAARLPLYYYRRVPHSASHSQKSYSQEHVTRAYILK